MKKVTTINDVFKFVRLEAGGSSKPQPLQPPLHLPPQTHVPAHPLAGALPDKKADPPWGRAKPISSVGVADLMVVKQQILRYEATEIAHIENVMATETRDRTHRFLERVEETVTLEREITDTKERELETSERFELNKEASQTIREDQKYGFDLSVSAKYGNVVEVRSGFDFESSESRETSTKSSANYAKNVTDRSLQRIEQRVREERIRKLIRETEETNHHGFKNDTGEHVVGIYQFVDKIYEAQVFNYGKRQMFDLFVPEPASFIWHIEKHPQEEETSAPIPAPPVALTIRPTDLSPTPTTDPTKMFYADLVARYGATGVQSPRERTLSVSKSREFPSPTETAPGSGSADDMGAPRFMDILAVKIPDGYRPTSAVLAMLSSSDAPDHTNIYYSLERTTGRWVGSEADGPAHSNIRRGTVAATLSNFSAYSAEGEGELLVNVLVWDASQWAISVHVTCELTSESVQKWQLATYEALSAAYFERFKEWQNEVDRIKADVVAREDGKATVGVPPSSRQNAIVTELKKHCISIFTGYWYDDPTVMVGHGASPPTFDLARAERIGSAIRFFEHAFEWHQIQYAFYPYYWAAQSSWQERVRRSDPDYQYQQFLQAGAARVIVPVRPGFEYAVSLYLDRGVIWEGRGEPPTIEDPTYLSIVDQLKEQSGEELDEPIPVGEPWEIRVPTSLIRLKRDATLPSWHRVEGEDWVWAPDPEA